MILEVQNITKVYNENVIANNNVNFSVNEGEIHGIVGENGAGKSTLMNILYGIQQATSGKVFLRGKEVSFNSSKDAIDAGIGMVHQHFQLVESLTAAENLRLGEGDRGFFINKEKDTDFLIENAKKFNLSINPNIKVRDMSVGMKQKLELLKCLTSGAEVIILDEPTAVLTPQETTDLFARFEEMKKRGLTIIFISHKLKEIKSICDRITILRNGETVGTYQTSEVTEEEISYLMVGRKINLSYEKSKQYPENKILAVKDLSYVDRFNVPKLKNISLNICDNEIVGVAGVDGNGQSELVASIMGRLAIQQGEVYLSQKEITDESIFDIRKYKFGYVTSDRMTSGLDVHSQIWENMVINTIDNYTEHGIIKSKKIYQDTESLISKYKIKANSPFDFTNSLSGGNMQKIVIGREFEEKENFLILDEPTRGVDIGAISFIHEQILEKREMGYGILLISSDMTELIALSDRILVMYDGVLVANLDNQEQKISESELGLYMLGLKNQEMGEVV